MDHQQNVSSPPRSSLTSSLATSAVHSPLPQPPIQPQPSQTFSRQQTQDIFAPVPTVVLSRLNSGRSSSSTIDERVGVAVAGEKDTVGTAPGSHNVSIGMNNSRSNSGNGNTITTATTTLTTANTANTNTNTTTASALAIHPLSGAVTTSNTNNAILSAINMNMAMNGAIDDDNFQEKWFPPANFSYVARGVYRSSFPRKKNFPFLKKLNMKSILTLVMEDYPDANMQFIRDNGINFFQFAVPGNKEPFVDIPEATIAAALAVLLDKRNHPILVHCNQGKHRTGCLIGCMRKVQRWLNTAIFDEYRRFAHPKVRSMDQQFIELFDISKVKYSKKYLPDWDELC